MALDTPSPPDAAEELFSPVDSARFGLRIGRAPLAAAAALPALLEACRRERLELLFVRCPSGALPAIHALEAAGGRLMDTLLYYRRGVGPAMVLEELRPNRIRPMREDDLPGIEAIARQCFAGYRGHYHADPRLDRALCDESYVDWALHCCRNRDKIGGVLVAEDSAGRPCGFLAIRLNSPAEAEGWLSGVSPGAEGRGVYWSLLVHAMRWSQARGATRVVAPTQLDNRTTQKAYARLGLALHASYHTFHLWLPSPSA